MYSRMYFGHIIADWQQTRTGMEIDLNSSVALLLFCLIVLNE